MSNNGFETVFDLPQLYSHPPAEELISALDYLELEPPSWDPQVNNRELQGETVSKIDEAGIPKFLTSIVASPLSWIHEDHREEIWETASKRLSERSGRSAIPSISRRFVIPDPSTNSCISIHLYEPSLTSDNLGHKTWLSSYLLAKRLPYLRPHLPLFNPLSELGRPSRSSAVPTEPLRILELGAGTGLVGITAAAIFPSASVHLTDLPAIIPNLQKNVSHNINFGPNLNVSRNITVGILDWSDLPPETENADALQKYDMIIAADPLYSPQHPAWLVNTITLFLSRGEHARVIMELPLRDVYEFEVEDFRTKMSGAGFVIVESGEEVGVEDWGRNMSGEDQSEVKCWWSVWKRKDDEVSFRGKVESHFQLKANAGLDLEPILV